MQYFLEWYHSLSDNEKKGLLAGVIAIVAVTIVLSIWIFKTDYGVLFSDLNDDDAARITEQLKSMKIQYRLEQSGSTILVDESIIHQTRLSLTAKGALIKGGIGFELFDKTEYGMTDFEQKINFQRALQGELTRTIMSLESVEHARVHITIPENRLFMNDRDDPKASVTLKLKTGKEVADGMIEGIQRLVSAAVMNMKIENVTILNDEGEVLSIDRSSEHFLHDQKIESKKDIENYLTAKAASVLDSVFGDGQGIVNIDVTLGYDAVTTQTEQVISSVGDSGVLVEKKVTTSKKSSPVDAKLQGKDEMITETQELKFQVGKEVENRTADKGNIIRITASVVVPDFATQAQIDSIRLLMANVIGINEARGDTIQVVSLPFLLAHSGGDPDKTSVKIPEDMPIHENQHSFSAIISKLFDYPMVQYLAVFLLIILFISNIALLILHRKKFIANADKRQKLIDEIKLAIHDNKLQGA